MATLYARSIATSKLSSARLSAPHTLNVACGGTPAEVMDRMMNEAGVVEAGTDDGVVVLALMLRSWWPVGAGSLNLLSVIGGDERQSI